MRVLLISNFFPPTSTTGTENYTYGIARGLLQAGHKVQILCAGQWDNGDQHWNGHTDEIYNAVPVRRLHLNWTRAPDPNRYLYDNPVVAAHFRGYLEQIGPDVVHITSCYTLTSSVIKVAKEAGLPVLVTLTDFWFLCPGHTLLRSDGQLCTGRTRPSECLGCVLWQGRIPRWLINHLPNTLLEPFLVAVSGHAFLSRHRGLRGMAFNIRERRSLLKERLALADCVVSPSEFLAGIHRDNGYGHSIHYQPYGHELSWLDAYPGKSSSQSIRFGYLGQIAPIKGIHILVEAFRQINRNGMADLTIYGGMPASGYAGILHSLSGDDTHIHFAGAVQHEHVGLAFSNIDCLVVPSLWYENNPLVIQEAFASNTPVIASDSGGMNEFVKNEVNGLLFERGNVEALAHQMRRVISEPGMLGRLRAGAPTVKTASEEVMELTALYSKVRSRLSIPSFSPDSISAFRTDNDSP